MSRLDLEWIGRRWFEMRVGYGTYLAFMFGFSNFVLLLHGLTDLFKDYPVHWFGIAAFCVIVPVSILVGHRHNRTQQKTETRNLTHLNPFINHLVPRSKEELFAEHDYATLNMMISTTKNEELRKELLNLRSVTERYIEGGPAYDPGDRWRPL